MPSPDADAATGAYTPLTHLLSALGGTRDPGERYTLLALAEHAALHPALAAYRADPMLPLSGVPISLDAQVAAVQAALRRCAVPDAAVGSVGGALYLPAASRAISCRVRVAYLSRAPLAHWDEPIPLQPISPDIEAAARRAFAAALHTLLFTCPAEVPPAPAPVYFAVENVPAALLCVVSGDSLAVPLALAFLSALAGLSVPQNYGATGGIAPPDVLTAVGHVPAKRAAFDAAARFEAPDGGSLGSLAAGIGGAWKQRFAHSSPAPPSVPLPAAPTFLRAEVAGAPALWEAHPAALRAALPLVASVLQGAVTQSGGFFWRNGDAYNGAFAGSADACRAAIRVQLALRAAIRDAPLNQLLCVRIGLHAGPGEPDSGGFRGAGVSQAARVAAAASGGQILATGSVTETFPGTAETAWSAQGAHRLRDCADYVTLYQLSAPGVGNTFAPPESLSTRRNNLPPFAAPLVGRDTEVAALAVLLKSHRLVSVTGLGGVGKTRLAVAAAADVLLQSERFEDGAFFVPVTTGLSAAVAEAVGIAAANAVGDDMVIAALSPRRLLLVLDGAETQASEVAAFAARLLAAAPHVSLLVTSRAPLRCAGERRCAALALSLPEADADAEAFAQSGAVRLFLDRARAADETFTVVSPPDRETMARLVRRLDGLPLALELAAARVRHLSVSDIEARLSESLSLLSTRAGDIPARQRTLLATMEWSYDLLLPPEKSLLRCVTVFADGFDTAAAEAITEPDALDALDALESLESQGLLSVMRDGEGEPPRFHLPRMVADFAREKRDAAGEGDRCRAAHAQYFARLAAVCGGTRTPLSTGEADAFDRLDREMANLRAAWEFFRGAGDGWASAGFAADLTDFLRRRGHAAERSAWVEATLRVPGVPPAIHSRLLHARALTLKDAGRVEEADAAATVLQSLGETSDDETGTAAALALRGTIAVRAKQYPEAEAFLDRADVLYKEAGDARGIALVAGNRALAALRAGNNALAEERLRAALALCQSSGDAHGEAYAHNNLGFLLQNRKQYTEARQHYTAQLVYCREQRDTTGAAVSLFNIGEALLHENRPGGFALLIVAGELFARLAHAYAAGARDAITHWAGEQRIPLEELAVMRRDASRRSTRYLRETVTPQISTVDE